MKKQKQEIKRERDDEKMSEILLSLFWLCAIPISFYFCVKLGTVAYYKGKQFINKQKEGDTSNE